MNAPINLKFWSSDQTTGFAGATLTETGVGLVALHHRDNGKIELTHCDWQPYNRQQTSDVQLLETMARDNLIGRTPCTTCLNPGSYDIFLVDRPAIPADELKTAIRWQIKDLIDFPIEEASVDLFSTAPMGAAGEQKLYVVVVRTAELLVRANALQNAGLNLNVIDIPELSIRNLASQLREAEHGLVMLHLEANNGIIVLVRGDTLYLARSIDIGNEQLFETLPNPDQLERLAADIALEIQRSTNYYDMQFRQPQLTQLVTTALPFEAANFFTLLQAESGLDTRQLQLSEIVDTDLSLSAQTVANTTLTLGSALRPVK